MSIIPIVSPLGCATAENTHWSSTLGMNSLLTFIGWLILLVLCWPLALLALVLWPLVWLISLPFRLVGITFDALFALLRAVLLLPARVLGYKVKK